MVSLFVHRLYITGPLDTRGWFDCYRHGKLSVSRPKFKSCLTRKPCHLFQQAFAEADPAPSLLQVVKDHPTYKEAVEENPSRGRVLASALAKLDALSDDIDGELARAVHFHADFANEVKDYDKLERLKHVFKIQR